jgi:hypothetical protein
VVFFVNVPVGLVIMAAASGIMPTVPRRRPARGSRRDGAVRRLVVARLAMLAALALFMLWIAACAALLTWMRRAAV